MDYHFRNLVFEGGGVKGIGYVGALRILQEKEILPNIKRVGGTSAGAVVALLVGLNFNAEEIENILRDLDFNNFLDDSWGIIRNVDRLITKRGWYEGEYFRNWIRQLVESKTQNPNATFKDIAAADPAKGFKELFFIGTNLSTRDSVVFSLENTAAMSLADAVRISMSIPLFFVAVKNSANVYIDGGVVDNYPVKLFDQLKYVEQYSSEPEYYRQHNINLQQSGSETSPYVFNQETLGFRLDSAADIALFNGQTPPEHHKIDDLFTFTWNLAEIYLEAQQRQHLHSDDWQRTIYIDTLGVKTTQFDLTAEKKDALVESGAESAKRYFEWFDNPENVVLNRPLTD